MAHKGTIKIDGNDYEVLSCSYSMYQHVNPHYQRNDFGSIWRKY
jgi:hypothetical protein